MQQIVISTESSKFLVMIYLGVNNFPAGCRDGKAESSAQTENQLFASATVRCAEPDRATLRGTCLEQRVHR